MAEGHFDWPKANLRFYSEAIEDGRSNKIFKTPIIFDDGPGALAPEAAKLPSPNGLRAFGDSARQTPKGGLRPVWPEARPKPLGPPQAVAPRVVVPPKGHHDHHDERAQVPKGPVRARSGGGDYVPTTTSEGSVAPVARGGGDPSAPRVVLAQDLRSCARPPLGAYGSVGTPEALLRDGR